jgi:hypothetical protein
MVNIRIRKGVITVYLSFSSIWYLLQRLTKTVEVLWSAGRQVESEMGIKAVDTRSSENVTKLKFL